MKLSLLAKTSFKECIVSVWVTALLMTVETCHCKVDIFLLDLNLPHFPTVSYIGPTSSSKGLGEKKKKKGRERSFVICKWKLEVKWSMHEHTPAWDTFSSLVMFVFYLFQVRLRWISRNSWFPTKPVPFSVNLLSACTSGAFIPGVTAVQCHSTSAVIPLNYPAPSNSRNVRCTRACTGVKNK